MNILSVSYPHLAVSKRQGLGTWVAVNLGTEKIDAEGLYKVDLTSEEYGTTKLQINNYYGSCYKVCLLYTSRCV